MHQQRNYRRANCNADVPQTTRTSEQKKNKLKTKTLQAVNFFNTDKIFTKRQVKIYSKRQKSIGELLQIVGITVFRF